ncbi:MAG: threonylcarbamoyl-AMP synthase [Deltaproteobacteria bacterium]|nr:MAG: threonylcarbamoyl-AMP synthase [Deltaproteobacteria bacterium]
MTGGTRSELSVQQILEAADVIRAGGIVIVPTGALYGLAADPFSDTAVDRIFAVKGRSKNHPLLLLIPDGSYAAALAPDLPAYARALMKAFWPGRLTLVVKTAMQFAAGVAASEGHVGIRLPAHPCTRALVRTLGFPVTGTSANLTGQAGAGVVADIPRSVRDQSSMILDAGPLPGRLASTVVDVTGDAPRILREGRVSSEAIRRLFESG